MTQTEGIKTNDAECLRLLEEFGEAWNAGNVEKLLSMMTDDCVYLASVGPEPGTTYTGKEAVRKGFLAMLALDSHGESRAGRAFVAGNLGVSEWSYLFRTSPGANVEIRGCDIFEFRGGLISRKDAFRKSFPGPGSVTEAPNNVNRCK